MNRRRSTAVLSLAASIGLVVAVVGGTADAAGDTAAAKATSHWLATKLKPDGTLENPMGGELPDHGLMIDTLFAMHASGDAALAAPIVTFLDDLRHATDYYTWDKLVPIPGSDQIIIGGSAAKVLVAAEVAGRDPRAFGGHDMVAETLGAIRRSGPDKGRVSDYSKKPELAEYVSNNANMFGQALGVIGLAAAGANDQLAIDKLLTQQCSEGYFRIYFAYIPTTETGDHVSPDGYKVSTCDEGKAFDVSPPDGDPTGLGLSALLAARAAGAQGLDPAIGKAVAWLKANQTPGGGWGGGVGTEAPNTNSTGLIVQALADAGGAEAEVAKGVAFLKSAQATAAADSGNRLAGELGAIAYNPDSYVAARTTGISGLDTWIRASAQASLGLAQVGFFDLAKGKRPGEPSSPSESSPPVSTPPVSTTTTTTTVTSTSTTTTTKTTTTTETPPTVTTTAAPVTKTVTTTAPAPQAAKATGTPPPARRTTASQPVRTAAPPAPPSPPQPPSATASARLAGYLAAKLTGDHVEVTEDGKTFVDYEATADLVLALRALGEQPDAVTRASAFLLTPDAVNAYAHGAPYEQNASYAEALAKLSIIARFQQADDLAGQLQSALTGLRSPTGAFTDVGSFADNSTRRQSWAILATATDPGAAVDLLLTYQCADGTFPARLDTPGCATGDLAATAAAVTALNSRPHTEEAPWATLPPEWSPHRATALTTATAALGARVDGTGMVAGEGGAPDTALSATVAAARQAAGLDATVTAKTLGDLLAADGGLTKASIGDGGGKTDFGTTLSAAAGVAGRSWLSAPGSPVSAAVRLPLANFQADSQKPVLVTAAATHRRVPVEWVIGLGACLLLGGLIYAIRRRSARKGTTP
ncbi:hypothetical protein AB5J62_22800 [Amycolatopsis sp. cg5]|uniref:hypothetical protein n=1 Tax=Amycolatopsis sp. cg5 TaxID=3238802 RepID=UPI0035232109